MILCLSCWSIKCVLIVQMRMIDCACVSPLSFSFSMCVCVCVCVYVFDGLISVMCWND